MEFLTQILQGVGAAWGGVTAVVGITQTVVGVLRARMRRAHAQQVLAYLRSLGSVNEASIRQLVEGWAGSQKLQKEQREELIALLVNFVRNARFHTTNGTPLSTFRRCEQFIEQLLTDIQPCRRKDEPVGPGHQEWKLEQFLGMGSFGEVWLGRNKGYPTPRAFKFFTREGARKWLEQEQQALFHVQQRLHGHPNIIEFLDVVVGDQRWPFLVLEYVGGGSLEDWIYTPLAERAKLDVREIAEGVARGLAKAHCEGIYHRDLKPANILLTEGPDVQPKIADFGLGLVVQDTGRTSSVTTSEAVVVGTRMYLPPEASDPYAPRLPAQDDVFAFGVIYYQLLVGRQERPPYDFADELHAQGIDSATIDVVDRCLAHPARRFKDASEVLEALEGQIPITWDVPEGCFDVGPLAAEYLYSQRA